VIVLWGVIGLFQKVGTSRVAARSLLVWLTAGYLLLLPMLLARAGVSGLNWRTVLIGVLGGFTNGLRARYLFASLEAGAKASVAVPLTALNPLVTMVSTFGFLGERLTALQWGGVTVAIFAGAMLSYEKEAS
jgi:drug/metabolite transporter (DMT)-like permease